MWVRGSNNETRNQQSARLTKPNPTPWSCGQAGRARRPGTSQRRRSSQHARCDAHGRLAGALPPRDQQGPDLGRRSPLDGR
eukprot:9469244-Pyramimonas_sp.AAC.1